MNLSARFGSNAIINNDAGVPTLTISLTDLSETGDLSEANGLDSTQVAEYGASITADAAADKILAALIILNRKNQPTNTDAEGIVIDNPSKFSQNRNGTDQVEWGYPVNMYVPDNDSFDPDDLVS